MKKYLAVFVFLCCLIQCISCSEPVQSNEPNIPSLSIKTLRENITSVQEINPPVSIEMKLLMAENGCKAYIPWIADEQYNSANEKIEAFIMERINGVMDTGWDDSFFMNFDYEITYNQNEILSFYFTEKSFIGWRSHDSLLGINIDLKTGNLIPIKELVVIDKTFLDDLFSYRGDKYGRKEHIVSYLLDTHGEEELLENIRDEKSNYYFSQDYLFISFSFPQALGYHLEMGVEWERTIAPDD